MLEREFWKKVTYNPPTYCADVAGTLFDKDNWGWDVSRLDSLLSRTLKRKGITLEGVNSSYLYFGMWRALFAWHTEDLDLYSVNYLHFGAPKFWYAIAPEDRERFEILAQGMVPEMWRACPEFLRHKELLISPTLLEQNGIKFTRMMQHAGEFVVTYPGSYHSGFNTGFNCAESCNFATEAWVEIGEEAGICECVPDTVRLDMSIFDDNVCRRVDETDYTAVNRGRIGAPRKRAPSEEADEKTGKKKAKSTGVEGGGGEVGRSMGGKLKLRMPAGDGECAVLVPEGWERTVVKRETPDVKGDRDTYYKSPCGQMLKSKYEVTKYLGSNPTAGVAVKDFYFEKSPGDLPPARLLAPGTPSPSNSGDASRRKGASGDSMASKKSSAKGTKERSPRTTASSSSKGNKIGVTKKMGKKADPATPRTPTARAAAGKRDSLGGFLSPLSFGLSPAKRASARISVKTTGGHTRGVRAFLRDSLRGAMGSAMPPPPGDGRSRKTNSSVTSPRRAPMSRSERANAQPVELETFKRWKAGGLLEGAVSKVMHRANAVGKSIRGSSLVMQVEQALGVGSGSLRRHGTQIQTMSRTLSKQRN